jgi:ribosomal protein S18 acetylase RimI-like enzyme
MVNIEKAKNEHADIIAALGTTTFYETYSAYNTASDMDKYTTEHYNNRRIATEIATPGISYFIAYADNVPAGFAKLRNEKQQPGLTDTRHIELERIYVLQSFKKLGIGKALIDTCIKISRDEGYEVIWLGVWQQNQPAIKFYEKIGFECFGEHNFLLGEDLQRDFLMKLKL